jgi:hypothetical protein
MTTPATHRRSKPSRPPFENRFGSGDQGWRWFEELEYLGPEVVRLRLLPLAQQGGDQPFEAPHGFAHDWLAFRDRRDRRDRNRWRMAVLILTAIAALFSVVAALPVLHGGF